MNCFTLHSRVNMNLNMSVLLFKGECNDAIVFFFKCETSALSHCEWIAFYCLHWWNKQQFSQCFCRTLTWTTRRSVFWRDAAETSSVGVVRNLFLSLHGFGGRFWCPEYILLFLLPSSLSQCTVLGVCQQHNAADLFSPPPCSRYGWGAGGLPWQPLLRGNGGSDLRGKELCGETENKCVQSRRCRVHGHIKKVLG